MADPTTEVRTPKKWIVCSSTQYKQWASNTSDTGTKIDPYNLYLVNTGIEAGVGKYTELYYGFNRLTDIQIVSDINDETIVGLPNNKLIIVIEPAADTSGNGNGTEKFTVNSLKVKYDDQIWSIADFSFKSLRKDGNTLIMEVGGNSVDSSVSNPIYIPILPELPETGTGEKYLDDTGHYTVPSGGTSYTAGDGVTISAGNEISAVANAGAGITVSSTGIGIKLAASNPNLAFDANGGLYSTGGGGGGTTYAAGKNISIDSNNPPKISAIYAGGSYITINDDTTQSPVRNQVIDVNTTDLLTALLPDIKNAIASDSNLINQIVSSVISQIFPVDDGTVSGP